MENKLLSFSLDGTSSILLLIIIDVFISGEIFIKYYFLKKRD